MHIYLAVFDLVFLNTKSHVKMKSTGSCSLIIRGSEWGGGGGGGGPHVGCRLKFSTFVGCR